MSERTEIGLNKLAQIHGEWVESVGWHNKTPLECLALITEEIGEATHECRGEKPTEQFGVELVDIILRTLDLGYQHGVDFDSVCEIKMAVNLEKGTKGRLK